MVGGAEPSGMETGRSLAASRPGRRIRLLVITNSLDVGGTERHLLHILPGLDPARFEIKLLLLRRGGALEQPMAAAGIALHGSPFRRFPLRPLLGFFNAARLIRQWQPDLVHCFLPESYLVGGGAAWLSGAAPRLMSRRSLNDYQRKHPLAGWLERRLHRRMTLLLGNAGAVVQQLIAEGMPAARVGLIHNGVSLAAPSRERAALRQALGIGAETLVFLLSASLIPYKGHADLIEALAQAAPHLPSDHVVLCAGADRQGWGAGLRALAKAHGVAERLIWLGEIARPEDMAALLGCADAGLLCSHEEGFSNAVLEGMAAGLPMLVTNVGGNAEAVGEAGLVVPARDPAALAQGLVALADPARRAALGMAARQRAARHFTLPACLAQYDALYTALAAGQPAEQALAALQPVPSQG